MLDLGSTYRRLGMWHIDIWIVGIIVAGRGLDGDAC